MIASSLKLDLSEHYLDKVLRKYFRREVAQE
jgi:hypothetical protein